MSTLLRVCCASIPYAASPLAWIHGFHSSQALASIQTSNPTIGISLPLSLSLSLSLMLKNLQFTSVEPTKKLTMTEVVC